MSPVTNELNESYSNKILLYHNVTDYKSKRMDPECMLGAQETISDLENSVSKIRIVEEGFQENTGLSGDFWPSPVIKLLAHSVLIQMSWF